MATSRSPGDSDVQVFRRRGYETRASRRMRVVEVSTRLLMFTLIPVALVVTVRMLLGQSVVGVGIGGSIIAVASSIFLTLYRMLSTPARVVVAQDAVSVDDAWSVRSSDRSTRQWGRVLDCRGDADSVEATIGLGTYHFVRSDWLEFELLRDVLLRLASSREGPMS